MTIDSDFCPGEIPVSSILHDYEGWGEYELSMSWVDASQRPRVTKCWEAWIKFDPVLGTWLVKESYKAEVRYFVPEKGAGNERF